MVRALNFFILIGKITTRVLNILKFCRVSSLLFGG